MSHEPECRTRDNSPALCGMCVTIRAAYRRGFNDHAAARAKSEAMFGTYQHGQGENP